MDEEFVRVCELRMFGSSRAVLLLIGEGRGVGLSDRVNKDKDHINFETGEEAGTLVLVSRLIKGNLASIVAKTESDFHY